MEYYISDSEFEKIALEEGYLSREQIQRCKEAQKGDTSSQGKMLHEVALNFRFLNTNEMEGVYAKNKSSSKSITIGGYEIRSILGEGGLGIVYLARQISMKRNVALKILYRKWIKDEEFRKRFLLEARIVGKLSHPNLIQVFDIGYDKGHYYFSMEYVAGKNLLKIIEEDGYFPLNRAIEIILQILDALNYIWKKNLVHRDIKPGNIILNQSNIPKLGDFGFVKCKLDDKLKMEDFVLGTPDYMSPEQAKGLDSVDHRSDIYSLGATLYHMVTGSAPYSGSESVVIRQHIKAAIPSPKSLMPDLPDSICDIIEKMMAKDPSDRYQQYEQIRQDLSLVKSGGRPKIQRLDPLKSTISRQGDYLGIPIKRIYKLERELKKMYDREMIYQSIITFLVLAIILLFIYR